MIDSRDDEGPVLVNAGPTQRALREAEALEARTRASAVIQAPPSPGRFPGPARCGEGAARMTKHRRSLCPACSEPAQACTSFHPAVSGLYPGTTERYSCCGRSWGWRVDEDRRWVRDDAVPGCVAG